MDFVSILGLTGMALDLVRAAPQLARLIRDKRSFGVSVDTSGTSCAVSLGWATYGLVTDQIFVTLASGIMASFFLITTLVALRYGRSAREFQITPIWLEGLSASVLFFGKTGLGLMLSISALISNVPQIQVAYKEENLSGLSLETWLLTLAGGLIWGLYAILRHDLTIITSAFLQSVTSGIIIGLKLFKRSNNGISNQEFTPD